MTYIVLTTVDNRSEGERIASRLVEEKLAACVNVLPEVRSTYWWKGKVEKSDELLLVIKTTPERLDELVSRIEEIHSYETPEVLAIPVEKEPKKYLEWLEKNVR